MKLYSRLKRILQRKTDVWCFFFRLYQLQFYDLLLLTCTHTHMHIYISKKNFWFNLGRGKNVRRPGNEMIWRSEWTDGGTYCRGRGYTLSDHVCQRRTSLRIMIWTDSSAMISYTLKALCLHIHSPHCSPSGLLGLLKLPKFFENIK